MPCVGLQ